MVTIQGGKVMTDEYGRKIDYLRLSLTDKCNLRCIYCIPSDAEEIPHFDKILSMDQIFDICSAMSDLGIRKLKLTGGEPLVRSGISEFIAKVKNETKIQNVTLTTNGILLKKHLDDLSKAGLDAINISLDTLDTTTYKELTGFDKLGSVLDSIDYACETNIPSIKINCVPLGKINEDDLVPIAKMAKDKNIHVRFIELMPIGFGKKFESVSTKDVMNKIQNELGILIPFDGQLGNGPARYYKIDGFKGKIGFISALSNKFCSGCNRIRLTSSGFLKTCLHFNKGIDLLPYLKNGNSDELKNSILKAVSDKPLHHSFGDKDNKENVDDNNMVSIGG